MQRFISINSGNDKLHSLLLQHHINKQRDGVEIAEIHPPIVSPPQPQPTFSLNGPITSPIFFTPMTSTPTAAKPQGAIARTLSNLFTRKGSQVE